MSVVRVSESCVVVHPTDGGAITLTEHTPYDRSDPLVKAYPWAFESDVERATAAPGEKRTATRKK